MQCSARGYAEGECSAAVVTVSQVKASESSRTEDVDQGQQQDL